MFFPLLNVKTVQFLYPPEEAVYSVAHA